MRWTRGHRQYPVIGRSIDNPGEIPNRLTTRAFNSQNARHRQGGCAKMETNDLIAQLGDNAKAVLQKALQCAKRDDLLKLAAEHGITLSERQVDELLSYSQPGVEPLSDSELDAITGGSDKPRCRRCRTNKHVIGSTAGCAGGAGTTSTKGRPHARTEQATQSLQLSRSNA